MASSSARSSSSTSADGSRRADLQVEQRGGDHEELTGLVEVPVVVADAQVGEELVGDLCDRDQRDVEPALGDQRQQQVERSVEDVEMDMERRSASSTASSAPAPGRRGIDRIVASRQAPLDGSPALRCLAGAARRDSWPGSAARSDACRIRSADGTDQLQQGRLLPGERDQRQHEQQRRSPTAPRAPGRPTAASRRLRGSVDHSATPELERRHRDQREQPTGEVHHAEPERDPLPEARSDDLRAVQDRDG